MKAILKLQVFNTQCRIKICLICVSLYDDNDAQIKYKYLYIHIYLYICLFAVVLHFSLMIHKGRWIRLHLCLCSKFFIR